MVPAQVPSDGHGRLPPKDEQSISQQYAVPPPHWFGVLHMVM